MISPATFIVLALDFIIGMAVPILLAVWLVKKYNCRMEKILIGAGVFFLFALVLESLVHLVVLKNTGIQDNKIAFAIYGGLMAGLFEETGRFLAFKFLLKKDNNHTALAYGVGHGGMEVIMVFAMAMLSNLIIGIMANTGNVDLLLAKAPDDPAAKEQMDAIVATLSATSPGTYLIGLWERCSAMILQISLSVLVFVAVRKGGRFIWLFPSAILLHALVDGIVVLIADGIPMVIVEVIVMAMAIAVAGMAFTIHRRTKTLPDV